MAATAKFDFKTSTKAIELKVEEGLYTFLEDGSVKLGDAVLTEKEALSKAAKAFAGAAKTASAAEISDAEHVNLLREAYKKLATAHSAELDGVTGIFKAADEIEAALKRIPANAAADASTASELKKILVANPEARNLLNADAHNTLHLNTFKNAEGKLVRIVDFPKLEGEVTKLRGTIDELVKLHATEVYDEAAVKKLLAKAPEGIKDVLPAEIKDDFLKGVSGVKGKTNIAAIDLEHLAGTVEADISAAKAEALSLGNKIVSLKEQAGKSFFPRKFDKQIEQAGTEFSALVEKNKDISHHLQGAMEKAFTAEERAAIASAKGASAGMSALAKGAATSAAKEGEGWFSKAISFKHTEKSLGIAEARTAGKTAEEIGKLEAKIGKFRWGKAGLAAAGLGGIYLIGSALAGTGNKGPGDKAAAIDQERQNLEPAMAR